MDLRAPLHDAHANSKAPWIVESSLSSISNENNDTQKIKLSSSYEKIISHHLCQMHVSSQSLELGCESRFTGLVLYHRYARRFYHSIVQKKQRQRKEKQKSHQDYVDDNNIDHIKNHLGKVAAACLFLGCKMEEEPRRIRDVINLSHVLNFSMYHDDDTKVIVDTSDGISSNNVLDTNKTKRSEQVEVPIIYESKNPPPLDESYWSAKEGMVSVEQHVLRMINFDTTVCHPHRCVLMIMETLGFGRITSSNDVKTNAHDTSTWLLSSQQSDNIILRSYMILNEATLDPRGVALEYPVIVLSCATISLACRIKVNVDDDNIDDDDDDKEEVELPDCWWRALDVSTNDINRAKLALQKEVLDM